MIATKEQNPEIARKRHFFPQSLEGWRRKTQSGRSIYRKCIV